MKVLLINGSSNEHGCTYTALNEVAETLNKNDIETEIIYLGKDAIRDCIGCRACKNTGKCIFNDDIVNEIIDKAKDCDGFVFGSPVYYAHPSGRILSFMDRLFYAGGKNFEYKPACAVVSARRSGTTASMDVINKHFLINNMPVVPSNYWNNVHGHQSKEVKQDFEGMQVMRTIAYNMIWMLKSFEMAKNAGITPEKEEKIYTNFYKANS